MIIEFAAADTIRPRLIASLVAQDGLPADADVLVREAAAAARFSGKTGQLFEAMVPAGAGVQRLAFAGIGEPGAAGRTAALERAGGAITAKYLTSGETELAIDFAGSGLTAEEAAAVLLAMRLRAWRHDVYRTKLSDEQKPSLAKIVVFGAPEGTEAVWETEAAIAEGVEFTRELVTEPANIIYPASFVER